MDEREAETVSNRNPAKFEEIISRLEPATIASFLRRNGYIRVGTESGIMEAYRDDSGRSILLPLDKQLGDYRRRLCEIVDLFAVDDLTSDDVLSLIVLPESDILRYRIETPDSSWGSLQLGYTYEATHALFDVLKYTAAGVSSHKRDYTNVSTEAQAFANGCRFGQTELGSFVLKVYCPVRPPSLPSFEYAAFGRETTKATLENFEFISSDESANPSVPLPASMNRQVASAVHRLKPYSDFGTSIVAVRYGPRTIMPNPGLPLSIQPPQIEMAEQPVQLDLGPLVYSRAQSIRDRLKKAEEFGRETLVGYITDLHKDRPRSSVNEQSRQISMEVKYGSAFRKVTMRLVAGDYRKAVMWHDNNVQVRVDAVFDKRGKPWTVHELFELAAVDQGADAPSLFDGDPPTK
jgi:hypothetical protein